MKRLLLLLALLPAPALAQGGAAADPSSAVGAVAPIYAQVRGYLLAAAEQMPDADYGFKPTPQVRSFGQLVGHVANAQYAICAAALGETSPAQQNFEQTTDKAALVAALRASSEYCDRAYAQSDDAALQMTQLFGGQRTRLGVLVLNTSHNFEHYGNLVTYLRLKGLVPPSSQGN
ncbi:DinB family protein [Longimicrobium sp.]|uniref:DinB family protein n=1 Tax=Longimicrobium sp. TaxID=2029185 RepID=UPI002E31C13E|nr:DinB family protein [Longimicrobium sp.]HEX6040471.1 DinB family protein [Longimicrobium sp.]